MAEEFDVYQICLCGSGKKLKFCCLAIFDDMLKIIELQSQKQEQLALSAVAALEKKDIKEVWSRAWIKTVRAQIEWARGEKDSPLRLLTEVLDELPGHPFATIIYALVLLTGEGYLAAKRAVSAAFRIREAKVNVLRSFLAQMAGNMLGFEGHSLAAYRHYELARALDAENQGAVEALAELRRDSSILYPLRDNYSLEPFAGSEDLRAQYNEALELEQSGCFSDAAKAFGGIARQEPNQAWVWWNIALCHAWAAEEPLAVEAFKAAAANQTDPETAANSLLLARLLHVPTGAARVDHLSQEYHVQSVGKLLTRLDEAPLYVRMPRESHEDAGGSFLVAGYQVLDRDPRSIAIDAPTIDNLPLIVGHIFVFDADPRAGQPAKAHVCGIGQDQLEQSKTLFARIAGADAEPVGDAIVTESTPAETVALDLPVYLPLEIKSEQRRALQRTRWQKAIGEIWPAVPQESLGGKSPTEAAAVPELSVPLRAAILALDAFCQLTEYPLDQAPVRERLGLPPVTPIEVSPEENLARFSMVQLRRVPFDRITDGQLIEIVGRILRQTHSALTERILRAILSRPAVMEKTNLPNLYMTLTDICYHRLSIGEALEWIAQGKQVTKSQKQPLESQVVWEIQELIMRSADPNDPQLAEIAAKLWNYYRPKLPRLATLITNLLKNFRIPGPWNVGVGAGPEPESLAGAGVGAGGLWTPEGEAAGQPSKLWLPGQE
jgi:hypothetical protein